MVEAQDVDGVVYERSTLDPPPPIALPPRRFSWAAGFLGFVVLAFFSVVFLAALALAGGAELARTADGRLALRIDNLGAALMAAGALAIFAASMIGGYAAGRIALWNGAVHGATSIAWGTAVAILAVILASIARGAAPDVRLAGQTATAAFTLTVLTLLAALAGAMLGGRLGERYHVEEDRIVGPRGAVYGRSRSS